MTSNLKPPHACPTITPCEYFALSTTAASANIPKFNENTLVATQWILKIDGIPHCNTTLANPKAAIITKVETNATSISSGRNKLIIKIEKKTTERISGVSTESRYPFFKKKFIHD